MRFDCCWLYALSLPSGSRGMLHCKVDLKLLLRPAPFSNQRIASLPEPLVCTKITLGSKFRHKFRRKLPSRITANCSHVYSYHITAQIAFFFGPNTFPPIPSETWGWWAKQNFQHHIFRPRSSLLPGNSRDAVSGRDGFLSAWGLLQQEIITLQISWNELTTTVQVMRCSTIFHPISLKYSDLTFALIYCEILMFSMLWIYRKVGLQKTHFSCGHDP